MCESQGSKINGIVRGKFGKSSCLQRKIRTYYVVYAAKCHTVCCITSIVLLAYKNYDVDILERIEGIQYEIYRRILVDNGGNQFDMPHSGVRKRQREGADPCDRVVPPDVYDAAKERFCETSVKLNIAPFES